MTDTEPAPPLRIAEEIDPLTLGTVLGIIAAVCYTLTNICLREVAPGGGLQWAMWVTCNKAIPVSLVAWSIIGWRGARGLQALPPARLVLPLIGTGLVIQFGGNLLFQLALSRGGLALTVPLTFSTILLSSAVFSRLMLGEPVTARSIVSMAALMLAIVVLSQGANTASRSMVQDADFTSTLLAVVTACGAGCGYGFCGVIIRRTVTSDVSLSSTLVLISSTGVISFGLLSLWNFGPAELLATPPQAWLTMLAAGAFNAMAFFSISASYKRLTVLRVNLLNASQAAMASTAGVLFFAEPITVWLCVGILLTLFGLALMSRHDA